MEASPARFEPNGNFDPLVNSSLFGGSQIGVPSTGMAASTPARFEPDQGPFVGASTTPPRFAASQNNNAQNSDPRGAPTRSLSSSSAGGGADNKRRLVPLAAELLALSKGTSAASGSASVDFLASSSSPRGGMAAASSSTANDASSIPQLAIWRDRPVSGNSSSPSPQSLTARLIQGAVTSPKQQPNTRLQKVELVGRPSSGEAVSPSANNDQILNSPAGGKKGGGGVDNSEVMSVISRIRARSEERMKHGGGPAGGHTV